MLLNNNVEIKQEQILGFGIRIDERPVVVGHIDGKPFTAFILLGDYTDLKNSVKQTEPENFTEKDQFFNTANGYKEVFIRTKHDK